MDKTERQFKIELFAVLLLAGKAATQNRYGFHEKDVEAAVGTAVLIEKQAEKQISEKEKGKKS